MASFVELAGLYSNNSLRDKIRVAVASVAYTIVAEEPATANHANRLVWAKRAFSFPTQVAEEMTMAVLVANKAFTVAQILAAADAAIESAVADVVDVFATGA